jgi:hypothetical protein
MQETRVNEHQYNQVLTKEQAIRAIQNEWVRG